MKFKSELAAHVDGQKTSCHFIHHWKVCAASIVCSVWGTVRLGGVKLEIG